MFVVIYYKLYIYVNGSLYCVYTALVRSVLKWGSVVSLMGASDLPHWAFPEDIGFIFEDSLWRCCSAKALVLLGRLEVLGLESRWESRSSISCSSAKLLELFGFIGPGSTRMSFDVHPVLLTMSCTTFSRHSTGLEMWSLLWTVATGYIRPFWSWNCQMLFLSGDFILSLL